MAQQPSRQVDPPPPSPPPPPSGPRLGLNAFKASGDINLVTGFPAPPLLYIGNIAASKDRDLLRNLEITRVIQVLEDDQPPFKGDGIEYLTIPVEDAVSGGRCDLLSWFPRAVDFLDENQRSGEGGNVLVHCLMGSSRSGTVLAALLMWKVRIERDRALELARAARPIVAPNLAFMAQLKEWERVVFSDCEEGDSDE
ncbi:protein-tyrosine phosphatase-like protein [Zopfochytrium polystomum]|nr:protein-tyrosine phosphatase-like protein [Zopfochytrium polystomum]